METGTVHAVSLPSGMSPHGFAMDWPMAETQEGVNCHLCLQFALRWRASEPALDALLPAEVRTNPVTGSC